MFEVKVIEIIHNPGEDSINDFRIERLTMTCNTNPVKDIAKILINKRSPKKKTE